MERICSQREQSLYRLGPFSEGDGCAGKETGSLESFLPFQKWQLNLQVYTFTFNINMFRTEIMFKRFQESCYCSVLYVINVKTYNVLSLLLGSNHKVMVQVLFLPTMEVQKHHKRCCKVLDFCSQLHLGHLQKQMSIISKYFICKGMKKLWKVSGNCHFVGRFLIALFCDIKNRLVKTSCFQHTNSMAIMHNGINYQHVIQDCE